MDLCLGTAQLGMKYGINNECVFSEEKSIEIMKHAVSKKINFFDTAPVYGLSEKIIGSFIHDGNNGNQIKVISKISSESHEFLPQVELTLENLGIPCLEGCLLHHARDMYSKNAVNNALALKRHGLTKNIGVSVYEPQEALYAVKQQWIDYIQIPYNVFDQRLDHTTFFKEVKLNNKRVFARSILLQGLLIMSPDRVMTKLPFALEYIKKYNKIISNYGYSAIEAAIQFVKANKKIDYIVFGVDNKLQLETFIHIFNDEGNCEEMIKEIRESFQDVDDNVLMPTLW